jgi:hypothetical protein
MQLRLQRQGTHAQHIGRGIAQAQGEEGRGRRCIPGAVKAVVGHRARIAGLCMPTCLGRHFLLLHLGQTVQGLALRRDLAQARQHCQRGQQQQQGQGAQRQARARQKTPFMS